MRMTGGEAVVKSLTANGVEVVFGIPGTHNLAAYDALLDSDIRHINARHEQGAAFMADGYARASGKVGVCLCTSGPALLNTATSLGTAYCDSSPVLCVASQIPSEGIGQEKGYIHECRDQLACLRPVTGWCERADTVPAIPHVMHEAFARMRSGRPRPIAVEVPCDILDHSADTEIPTAATRVRSQPASDAIEHAVRLLASARHPLIWAGGGVISSEASAELQTLAERLQAAVCMTVMGKGAIPDDHPLSTGSSIVHLAGVEFMKKCDVVLAVGSRFTQEDTNNWTMSFPDALIHIDVDSAEHNRNIPAAVALTGDARESLKALNDRLPAQAGRDPTARLADIAQLRQAILDDCREIAPLGVELVEALQGALPRETVVVSDLTLGAYWCRRLLPTYEPRTNIYPWGFCTLGFGLPAGIGAKMAQPDRPVVVLSGDGGFLFNCQELATAVESDLPVVVVLFNNNSYGVLKPQQQQRYQRTLGTDLVNPDFVALSEAFGVDSCRVDSLDKLGTAVETAISSNRSWVIELTVDIPVPVMEPALRALLGA